MSLTRNTYVPVSVKTGTSGYPRGAACITRPVAVALGSVNRWRYSKCALGGAVCGA